VIPLKFLVLNFKRIFFGLIFLMTLTSINASANVVGIATQTFNPTSNGIDFVTVESSETLRPGILNIGLFANYATNTLPNYEDLSTQSFIQVQDSLVSTDFNIGVGLLKNWDIGLTIPQILRQQIEGNTTGVFRGFFETTGVTEIRGNTKVKLLGNQNWGLAISGVANLYLVENYPFTGINPGPTFTGQLIANTKFKKFNLGANIGYRLRNPGQRVPVVPLAPYPNEFLASLAVSYLFTQIDTKLIAEIFTSFPTENVTFTSDRGISNAEALLGVKHDLTNAIALHLGVGTEMYHGSGSPDFRVYGGVHWPLGPLWKSKPQPLQPLKMVTIDEEPSEIIYLEDANFEATSTRKVENFRAKDVLFAFDSDAVNPAFLPVLQRLAGYLERGDGFRSLRITGHTDSIGSLDYNDDLSQRRATSVRRVLIQYLQPENRNKVFGSGRGEREPIADNGNYQGRALNRRVDFQISR